MGFLSGSVAGWEMNLAPESELVEEEVEETGRLFRAGKSSSNLSAASRQTAAKANRRKDVSKDEIKRMVSVSFLSYYLTDTQKRVKRNKGG